MTTFTVHRNQLDPIKHGATTQSRVHIFCYEGEDIKKLSRMWTSVQVSIFICSQT